MAFFERQTTLLEALASAGPRQAGHVCVCVGRGQSRGWFATTVPLFCKSTPLDRLPFSSFFPCLAAWLQALAAQKGVALSVRGQESHCIM